MTNEDILKSIIILGTAALAGYLVADAISKPRMMPAYGGYGDPFGMPGWEYDDEPAFDFDAFDETGEFDDEPAFDEEGYEAPPAAGGWRQGAWKSVKKHAPTAWGYTKKAGGWAGERVKSGYEVARKYDWSGAAKKAHGGFMSAARAIDSITYQTPYPQASAAPSLAKTQVMAAAPRMTVFQQPSPEAFAKNRRRGKGRRRRSRR